MLCRAHLEHPSGVARDVTYQSVDLRHTEFHWVLTTLLCLPTENWEAKVTVFATQRADDFAGQHASVAAQSH